MYRLVFTRPGRKVLGLASGREAVHKPAFLRAGNAGLRPGGGGDFGYLKFLDIRSPLQRGGEERPLPSLVSLSIRITVLETEYAAPFMLHALAAA